MHQSPVLELKPKVIDKKLFEVAAAELFAQPIPSDEGLFDICKQIRTAPDVNLSDADPCRETSTVAMGDSDTRDIMSPQKKSRKLRSWEVKVRGPRLPLHSRYIVWRRQRTAIEKSAGTSSCMNHTFWCAVSGNRQMARIVRHNDESVREGYTRNGGKEAKLFTSALKAFQCSNRIVMAQRKHLDDFLRGRIIDDSNVDVPCLKYPRNFESPRMSSPGFGNDSKMMVINRRNTPSDLSRQLSSATDTTVSRQTVYRRLGHIGLYVRRPIRCVTLTATHCRLRLIFSREHSFWTEQWSCVMFSDESRFSLQSDSRRTLIWRAPGTRYHQENTIERNRYGGAG
ncbi:transposable element Tcb1 transposase [Trichonephila clavipes]|nr:transposable element Tcb1 transposase [Trichonephila clavipes]